MQVLLLSADLMIQSRVAGNLAAAGLTVQTAMSAAKLLDLASAGAVIVIDLATSGFDPAELVAQLKNLPQAPAAILAFGPHVLEEQLHAAVAAGCHGVFTRGQFLASAAAIVGKFAAQ